MSASLTAHSHAEGCAAHVTVRIGASKHPPASLQDMHNDIQDVLGQNYGVPDDIDEDDLLGELDALEADMTYETEHEAAGVPAYLQA